MFEKMCLLYWLKSKEYKNGDLTLLGTVVYDLYDDSVFYHNISPAKKRKATKLFVKQYLRFLYKSYGCDLRLHVERDDLWH